MPIFSEKNIIFIHIPKNAGMFIEKNLGLPSIISNFESHTGDNISLKLKVKSFVYSLYRSYKLDKERIKYLKNYLYGSFSSKYLFQHASLSEMIDYGMISTSDIKQCNIVAVHRHPLERAISIYKYWGFSKKMSFDAFCESVISNPKTVIDNFGLLMHLKTQYSFIKNDLGLEVNLLDFDNLTQEFSEFMNKVGYPVITSNQKVNSSSESKPNVSNKANSIIRKKYEIDYEFFGYN